ncbi:MAG: Type IV pilus assembly protein PilB [Candidatus Uhrbacteria bacterium GW2011_GWE2_40_58]|nr:MAG: Type IV pilus assembly protein PilB [Candidatus Uhrbacteria bacterium GW2011_GWF2_40_263]KKR67896.1 MAG: Type IV pilus assembly protein PilB [Candidatus Uhrbacteria bacterium GW2011_GWE2_40_58]OGL92496.1 MAG: hypothetical protein A2239_01640 [Candidatus Uhrbacteria bacterium RIFOXYA2_FULL_40_9]OGL96865.1 MAG: hypothetical protein A2332_01975 [Candidatus Uhrbacteria bacterium RIFOXYB2_FULL_41_18]HBK34539.1 hypothetical protein [Candidatus Uhrbacteria bacterium]
MPLSKEQLHEALVERGGVTEEQFQEAATAKEASHVEIDQVLVSRGLLKDEQVGQLIAWYYDVPFVNLRQIHILEEMTELLPESFARAHHILPVEEEKGIVQIATATPDDLIIKSLLEKYLRKPVTYMYATKRDLNNHMYLFRRDPSVVIKSLLEKQKGLGLGASMIDVVNAIIDFAYQSGASDIHIEPEDDYTVVRYRIDGIFMILSKFLLKTMKLSLHA